MARLLVAGFVSTVFGAFQFSEAIANYEPEMYIVFFALNGMVAWISWVASYRSIPWLSMALAVTIVCAIAAPDRESATIPEPPVC